ncbi:hypothetical protein [Microbacterium suaedae]|uniref:hypothetical protein n=1 Tax=Microbacterium suaedae TaxID=2067813 RepID=UPI0018E07CCF|nr:hypothetical protein [Microbacterium suaedae]
MAMAARAIDDDPQLAHEHAQAAMRHAGRVGVVRETLAITAYATGDFALALRELRTVRRITGRNDHIAMIVDSERGVGRPEKALEEGRHVDRDTLEVSQRVELAIALSGARLDLGQVELALHELDIPEDDPNRAFEWSAGLFAARAAVLEDLGRTEEASEWLRRAQIAEDAIASRLAEDDTVVIDEIVIDHPRAGAEDAREDTGASVGDGDPEQATERGDGGEASAEAGAGTASESDLSAGGDAQTSGDSAATVDAGTADAEAAAEAEEPSGRDAPSEAEEQRAADAPADGAAPVPGAATPEDSASEPRSANDVSVEDTAPVDDASIADEVAEILAEAGIVDDEDGASGDLGGADGPDSGADDGTGESGAARADEPVDASGDAPATSRPATDAPEDERPDGALF